MITRLNLSAAFGPIFTPIIRAVRAAYARNRAFLLLLMLFVSFRLLTILLLRSGGLIADFSDQDYYLRLGPSGGGQGLCPLSRPLVGLPAPLPGPDADPLPLGQRHPPLG